MTLNRKILALSAVLALPALAPAASGDHVCNLFLVDLEVAYVAYDQPPLGGQGGPWAFWLYVETNGEDGLQRGGQTLFGDWDICQLSENPDQAVL